MHGCRVRPQRTGVREQLDRRAPVGGQTCLVLGRLLGHMGMQWPPLYKCRDLGDPGRRHCPHRMDGRPDPGEPPVAPRLRAFGPCLDASVGKPLLLRRKRCVDAAGEVAGVEQRQPDSGGERGLPQRFAHGVRVGIPAATRRMVQVVELTDDRHTRDGHLRVHRGSQTQVGVRVKP